MNYVVVIVPIERPSAEPQKIYRQPPAELAGKGRIRGDIVSPAVEEDWEALQ